MKRLFDVVFAMIGLFLLSPVILGIAWKIKREMGGAVFFRQLRPGLHGAPFEMIKFRTMLDINDVAGRPLPDAQRLTALGAFLRSTSLDELPELWNVVKGDMSLVGPRPLLFRYLPCYTERENKRHDVRPGITGWAQINGRNTVDWDRRLELDVWYVENRSIFLDIKILTKTVIKVFRREDVVVDTNSLLDDLDVVRSK